jgi:hypothetical protein
MVKVDELVEKFPMKECFGCARKGHYAKYCRQSPYPSGQYFRLIRLLSRESSPQTHNPQSPHGGRGRGRPIFHFSEAYATMGLTGGRPPFGPTMILSRIWASASRLSKTVSGRSEHKRSRFDSPIPSRTRTRRHENRCRL